MELVTTTAGHTDHDVAWSIVTMTSPEPVCIACFIQHLEDPQFPSVQKRLILSILLGILKDNDDIIDLFRKSLLVVRHLLDILTDSDMYQEADVSIAISVCQTIIEKIQCEEIVLYLLDKIDWQFDMLNIGDKKILTCLLLTGQLLALSPVYTSILLQTHGELVEKLVYCLSSNNDHLQCTVLYIFVQVFESNFHDYLPPPLKQQLCDAILQLLNTHHDEELQMNMLALLKRLLKNKDTSSMIQTSDYREDCLVAGLKKLFVSKKEMLQTACSQCILYIATPGGSQRNQSVGDILNSDITEFLFESLHTQSTAQIESILNCLLKLTEYELFFTRCHAVYGTESILLVLDTLLAMRHTKLLVKAYSLLACFLERQPSSIPLFVNTSTLSVCVSRLEKGIEQPYKPIVIQTFRAMAAFCREEYLPSNYVYMALEILLKSVFKRMSHLHLEKILTTTSKNKGEIGEEELMILFIKVMSSTARLLDSSLNSCELDEASEQAGSGDINDTTQTVHKLYIQLIVDMVLPLVLVLYEKSKDTRLIIEHCDILLTTFKLDIPEILCLTKQLISCGWLTQLLSIKSCTRTISSSDKDKISMLLVMVYRQLSDTDCWTNQWFIVGLKQVELPELVNEANIDVIIEKTQSTESEYALLMILYYSYLNDNMMWSANILGKYTECFLINNADLNGLPVPCIKYIVFLLSWLSTQIDNGENSSLLYKCNRRILGLIRSVPTDSWYTHHTWLLHWLFTDNLISQNCGTSIARKWLPQMIEEIEHRENIDNIEDTTKSNVLSLILKQTQSPSVIVNLLVSDNEETSNQSFTVLEWITTKCVDKETELLDNLTKYITDIFQQLIRNNENITDFQIIHILQVLIILLTDCKFGYSINSKTVQSLYHVVKLVGQQEEDNKITSVSLQYILAILNLKTDLGHLGVSPMLTQNAEFMSKLEDCLFSQSWNLKNKSIFIVTWLAMSKQHINTVNHMRIPITYIIELISSCPVWCISGVLRLLTVSLSPPVKNSPIIFYRPNPMVVTTLYTKCEIRTVYMYIQQTLFQDNEDILEDTIHCLQVLFNYCKVYNNDLDKELLNHPWNQMLLDTIIQINHNKSISDSLLQLLSLFKVGEDKLTLSGNILVLWLHSVLNTTFTSDKIPYLQHIFSKVNKTEVNPQLILSVTDHLLQFTH